MTLYTAEERARLVEEHGEGMVIASETIGIPITWHPSGVIPQEARTAILALPDKPPRPKQRKDPNCRNQRKRRRS